MQHRSQVPPGCLQRVEWGQEALQAPPLHAVFPRFELLAFCSNLDCDAGCAAGPPRQALMLAHVQRVAAPLKAWLEAVGMLRCAPKLDAFGFITLRDVWEMQKDDLHLIGLSPDDTAKLLELLVTRGPGSGNVAGIEAVEEQRKRLNAAARAVSGGSPSPDGEAVAKPAW